MKQNILCCRNNLKKSFYKYFQKQTPVTLFFLRTLVHVLRTLFTHGRNHSIRTESDGNERQQDNVHERNMPIKCPTDDKAEGGRAGGGGWGGGRRRGGCGHNHATLSITAAESAFRRELQVDFPTAEQQVQR